MGMKDRSVAGFGEVGTDLQMGTDAARIPQRVAVSYGLARVEPSLTGIGAIRGEIGPS